MDPITLLAATAATSSALGIAGAISSGNAASANAESAANAADYNAEVDRQRATVAYQQGNANEEAQRRQAAQVLGRQRAATAQAGLDLASGSALDLYQQSATNAELDALNIRYGADLQARGAQQQGVLDEMSASQQRMNASSALTGGYLNAGAAALSSYGSYLGQRSQMQLARSRAGGLAQG